MTTTKRQEKIARLTRQIVVVLAKQLIFRARGDTRRAYRLGCEDLRASVADNDPTADNWYDACHFLESKLPEIVKLRQALVTLSPVFH